MFIERPEQGGGGRSSTVEIRILDQRKCQKISLESIIIVSEVQSLPRIKVITSREF